MAKSTSASSCGVADASGVAIAGDLRHGRAHDLGVGDLRPDRRQDVAGSRRIEEHAAHAVQAVLERSEQRRRRVVVEQRHLRKRAVHSRQVRPDRGQDFVAAAHCFVLRGSPDTSYGKSVWADAAPRGAFPRR